MDVWTVVISSISAIVVALLGVAGGQWYTRRSQRRKIEAEAEKLGAETRDIATGTALKLVQQLEQTVGRLQTTVESQEVDIESLRCEVTKKDEQITALAARIAELEATVSELEALRVKDRNKIRYWSGRTTHLTKGVKILTAQMEALGLTPDWVNGGEPLPRPSEDTVPP